MAVDLHQHLWPPELLAALRARTRPPRLDGWALELPGEPPFAVDPAAHDPLARRELAAAEGLDVVCLAASAALGLDRPPAEQAVPLADAWLNGALALAGPFRVWAAATLDVPDPGALRAALDRGAIGLELAADALAAPGARERLAPLLDVLDAARRPLLVHPGPAPAVGGAGPCLEGPDAPHAVPGRPTRGVPDAAHAAAARPSWWAPVVPYVAQLHAAWWAWADGGRARFPHLPVCFAALAGLGPLHGERHRARGGCDAPVDPLTFVETSSYGTRAVDAVLRVLGIDVVCHGSDRPYAAPAPLALDASALHAIRSANPGRLLAPGLQEVLTP